jgi:hypothetical protein
MHQRINKTEGFKGTVRDGSGSKWTHSKGPYIGRGAEIFNEYSRPPSCESSFKGTQA